MRQRVIPLTLTVVTVALLAVMAVAAPAAAQDPTATPQAAEPAQPAAPGTFPGMGPGMMRGSNGFGMMPGYGMNLGACLGAGMGFLGDWGGLQQSQIVAGALGMDLADYLAARRDGRSIAAIAEEQGVDAGTLVAALTDARQPLVDAAVEAGLMTQADADWLMTETETAFRNRLETPAAPGACAGMISRYFGVDLLETAAQALGMERQELLDALHDGQTLRSLLDENDIDAQAEIVDPVLEQERAVLEPLVEAGQLTDAQIDAILVQTRARLMQLLDVSGTDLGYGYRPGLGYGPMYGYGMMNQMGYGYNYLPQYGIGSWNMSGWNWDNLNSWWNSLP